MPAGRPTKYNKNVQESAEYYINSGFIEQGDVVPSFAGLAVYLGINRSTLYEWCKNHAKFSNTLERLENVQERLALAGGLKSEMNSTIVKLLLANHGYSERQQIDNTSSDGSMKPTVIEVVGGKSKG